MAYPLQTINICNLCPGVTYKFRARECDASFGPPYFSCSGYTSTFTFTVPGSLTPLNVTATANPNPICPPQTSQLTGTISGGCGPFSYVWTPAATLSNPNISNPVASPTIATTYSLTVNDLCQGTSANTSITVNVVGAPVAGTASVAPATVCSGQSVTLTLTGSSGGIQWQSGPSSTGPWTNIPGGTTTPFVTGPMTANTCFQAVVTGCSVATSNAVCITINPAPTPTAGPPATVCPSQPATITATGGGTYSWAPAGSLSCVTCASTVATPSVTTTYTVIVTDPNGCTGTANVTITIGGVGPAITIAPVAPGYCAGGSTPLTASGATNYVWSPAAGLNTTTGSTVTANPTVTTTYTVTGTSGGCTSTATVTVSVYTIPVAVPGPDVTICIGGTANISATASGGTGPYTFDWNPGAMSGSSVSVSPAATTTYTVVVTDANGCTGAPQIVTVTIGGPLSVTASSSPSTICIGASSTLSSIGNGGSGVYTYTWNPGALNGAVVTVTPTATTTYTVTVADNCGTPVATATVVVTVNPLPVICFSASDSSGCEPLCVTFTNCTPSSATCLWDLGNGTFSTNCTPNQCYMAGVYSITLSVTDVNGCVNTLSSTNLINSYPTPVACFTYSPLQTTILDPLISFSDCSSGASQWSWTFGDTANSTSVLQSPTFIYSDTGTYNVQQVVCNANQCCDTISDVVVILPDYTIYIPNSFTPDGDGLNDFFIPKGINIDNGHFEMWIFDRWGNQIYYTKTLSKPWDGKANNGSKLAQEDVYVWKIHTVDNFKKKKEYVGHVTTVR